MNRILRIGTRESQLAVWQANSVKELLAKEGISAELVYIKSAGDTDLVTPLYELGVQGIFTRALDVALLNGKIDLAVHSMKDVPTRLPNGVAQAAVLARASYKDLLVPRNNLDFLGHDELASILATSSTRRKAQWLNRYPNSSVEILRGNVNTRLRKLAESSWDGAIFAVAGLERIGLRPENSLELDWMLPAPAQGAIMVACRSEDELAKAICASLNDEATDICTRVERDFLRALLGGCSTPISALAVIEDNSLVFRGSILTTDGKEKLEVNLRAETRDYKDFGLKAGEAIFAEGGMAILQKIKNGS